MAGNQAARWFGVAALGLNAIDQMLFLPAYPWWSLAIIAMDVVALWGLCAYGSRQNIEAAWYAPHSAGGGSSRRGSWRAGRRAATPTSSRSSVATVVMIPAWTTARSHPPHADPRTLLQRRGRHRIRPARSTAPRAAWNAPGRPPPGARGRWLTTRCRLARVRRKAAIASDRLLAAEAPTVRSEERSSFRTDSLRLSTLRAEPGRLPDEDAGQARRRVNRSAAHAEELANDCRTRQGRNRADSLRPRSASVTGQMSTYISNFRRDPYLRVYRVS
jgi:hypothetical protein